MRQERITIPVAPWEIPDISADEWDYDPIFTPKKPKTGLKPGPKPKPKPQEQSTPAVIPKPIQSLAGRTFMGILNVSDLDYMAKAILQMCDEVHELRERVRILESGGK